MLTVGGEREFDILVNMHAGLSQRFWACSQVERCVDQVLTLLKPQNWSFLKVGQLPSLQEGILSAGDGSQVVDVTHSWYKYGTNEWKLLCEGSDLGT